jgi:hypothetical protein
MINATFSRDANNVPIAIDGLTSSTTKTFTGASATVNVPIFGFTGIVEIRALWGIVTTVLGANHTASSFRINDQTAQIYLTAVGGADISAYPVGSMISKVGLVATALTAKKADVGFVLEPTTLETITFSPVIIGDKTALTNNTIEYHYATTDNPTSGAMQFFVRWLPISSDANISPL